jgi:hypothetical protein
MITWLPKKWLVNASFSKGALQTAWKRAPIHGSPRSSFTAICYPLVGVTLRSCSRFCNVRSGSHIHAVDRHLSPWCCGVSSLAIGFTGSFIQFRVYKIAHAHSRDNAPRRPRSRFFRSVLPLDMVDNSINPLRTHFGLIFSSLGYRYVRCHGPQSKTVSRGGRVPNC